MNRLTLVLLGILAMAIPLLSPAEAVGEEAAPRTALVLIDFQLFYFPGGASELVDPGLASGNARKALERARAEGLLVVHVRQEAEPGGAIHGSVRPMAGEKVISKVEVNAFKDTELLATLKSHKIERVVIAGMMTHMCVEAAARAAADLGFGVVVIQDACATRPLSFSGVEVSARNVHLSALASIDRYYGRVVTTETFLRGLE